MSVSSVDLSWFSVSSGGTGLPFEGAHLATDLRLPEAAGRRTILVVDLRTGDADPTRLRQVEALATLQRDAGGLRTFAAIVVLGDVRVLSSPEHLVWLRPDAVWPELPDGVAGQAMFEAVKAVAGRREHMRGDLRRYQGLCRSLRIGGYAARADGSEFLWADDEIARILGFDNLASLIGSGLGPNAFFPAWGRLIHDLHGRAERAASTTIDVHPANGRASRARIIGILGKEDSAGETVSGYLHDFSALVNEAENEARQRMADVLDDLGYAYFVSGLDGKRLVTSVKDRELLDDPPPTDLPENYWADPGERTAWLRKLDKAKDQKLTEYPALLRTHKGRRKWVDVDARLVQGPDGKVEAVEGIYRDATRRKLAERMARALSTVGASDADTKRTGAIICESVAGLFDADTCAIMLRDVEHACVFPVHVWKDPECRGAARAPSALAKRIFAEEGIPWPTKLEEPLRTHDISDRLLDMAHAVFGPRIEEKLKLAILPLLHGERDDDDSQPSTREDVVRGYFVLPVMAPALFEHGGPELEGLLRLCTRQMELSASRDAFDLVREMLKARSSIADLKELDRTLDKARRVLQARMPMEGCSFFRTGIEDRQSILQLATTSGIEGNPVEATYAIGENNGLTAKVAHARAPLISVDKTKEEGHAGKHLEKMPHPGLTWMGVPFLDRSGKPLGVIRCVNRLSEGETKEITGFSFLDLRIVETFAHACAILTELALLQEERGRTLSRITHEIRTPAVGIQNNVRFLMRAYRPPDNKAAAVLSDLDLDASVLLNLLQEVDILRGKAVSWREPRVQTNVANIVRKTYFQLVPEMRARGFDPERVEIDLYALPMLWLPRAAFAQIVFNVFMNSIKYAHADPSRFSIRVDVERNTGNQWNRVHFKDTGIGVPEGQRQKIFEEGYRTPEARRHDARGLGLGLTISRKLMQQMGGDLQLVSGSGGADFVLTLPPELTRRPKGTS